MGRLAFHRYAIGVLGSVIVLIGVGGLVTSTESGLAVPDWPSTFGYNLFLFPFSRWVGGVFYEHLHRLTAAAVGILTFVLAVWAWWVEPRRWVRWLASGAALLVVLQGVIGGLRVIWLKQDLGLVHAVLAQGFLLVIGLVVLATSPFWWEGTELKTHAKAPAWLPWALGGTVVIVYSQILLGAAMRHAHLGLSILDFPTVYGKWWPVFTPDELANWNRWRMEHGWPPTTLGQIYLQWIHRGIGLALGLGALFYWVWGKKETSLPWFAGWSRLWGSLVVGEMGLGIATILTWRHPWIATAHVVLGSVILLLAGWAWVLVLKTRSQEVGRPNEKSPELLVPR
ncbi:COX15/CtaA family protein [Candidatus Methylacidithermus pantelleriae]|uniref:Heme A synthase (Cytochrome oxidase biogenesis protein CtaA) n=1 Tax=Candidatus Methylacidithermus pantelleriae TaxID=2744239 RepID=A0A8J2BLG3_9BACT|nr:COX15/CtaA family protein [Candidatus Methylacidithermus pantelleriae]CAF0689015.1 Heme A synthase (cytochrome oxidase biogenesis protein CtaA) [Candidatus Methylacidithermus pantelleriae]